jgi:hypothetical protein
MCDYISCDFPLESFILPRDQFPARMEILLQELYFLEESIFYLVDFDEILWSNHGYDSDSPTSPKAYPMVDKIGKQFSGIRIP